MDESKYLKKMEKIVENFGEIQRNFVLDKTGIKAIIKFVEDLEGRRPFFDLDDPVVQKGKKASEKVIEQLTQELNSLEKIKAPEKWKDFHSRLIHSLETQLQGYREMTLVFEDSDLIHIEEGQLIVNNGMKMLEGGKK
ncbi:MAG: hypothetical protein ACLFQV_01730 [Vulcanimicrobiota bacterium]